jgi:hypothetical protein
MPFSTPLCRAIEDAGDIATPALAKLYVHWRDQRRGRFAPARSDINPAKFPKLLPYVWLVDVEQAGETLDFRFRLGGERLIDFVGKRMTGKRINAYRHKPFFDNVAQVMTDCVREKLALHRPLAVASHEKRKHLLTEALYLPLSDNGSDISQIIGAFEMAAPVPA